MTLVPVLDRLLVRPEAPELLGELDGGVGADDLQARDVVGRLGGGSPGELDQHDVQADDDDVSGDARAEPDLEVVEAQPLQDGVELRGQDLLGGVPEVPQRPVDLRRPAEHVVDALQAVQMLDLGGLQTPQERLLAGGVGVHVRLDPGLVVEALLVAADIPFGAPRDARQRAPHRVDAARERPFQLDDPVAPPGGEPVGGIAVGVGHAAVGGCDPVRLPVLLWRGPVVPGGDQELVELGLGELPGDPRAVQPVQTWLQPPDGLLAREGLGLAPPPDGETGDVDASCQLGVTDARAFHEAGKDRSEPYAALLSSHDPLPPGRGMGRDRRVQRVLRGL